MIAGVLIKGICDRSDLFGFAINPRQGSATDTDWEELEELGVEELPKCTELRNWRGGLNWGTRSNSAKVL